MERVEIERRRNRQTKAETTLLAQKIRLATIIIVGINVGVVLLHARALNLFLLVAMYLCGNKLTTTI